MLDAYKALSEGILRPYGSLLVLLRDVATGAKSGEFSAYATLGDLEDALGPSTDELVRLARIGLAPELRNDRAYENAFRDGAGDVVTVLPDGSTVEIDLNDVYWRCTILRSFLDGVDVATNIASSSISDRSSWQLPGTPMPVSLKMLEHVLATFAGRLTDGACERVDVSGDEAKLVFEGDHRRGQLESFAAAARHVLDPTITRISVVRRDSAVLLATDS